MHTNSTSPPTPRSFDPDAHFTPEENARIQRPALAREAARARSAARRSAARGDDAAHQASLRALAADATRAEEENADFLATLTTGGEQP